MKTASHIRLKYFRNARSARKTVMHERTKKKVQMRQGDGSNVDKSDWLSRDVSKISSKVEDRLNETSVDVLNHFLKTLTKYKIQSGLYFHLSYQNAYLCRLIHHDHDYAKHTVTYDGTILAPRFADNTEDVWHLVLDPAKGQGTSWMRACINLRNLGTLRGAKLMKGQLKTASAKYQVLNYPASRNYFVIQLIYSEIKQCWLRRN